MLEYATGLDPTWKHTCCTKGFAEYRDSINPIQREFAVMRTQSTGVETIHVPLLDDTQYEMYRKRTKSLASYM